MMLASKNKFLCYTTYCFYQHLQFETTNSSCISFVQNGCFIECSTSVHHLRSKDIKLYIISNFHRNSIQHNFRTSKFFYRMHHNMCMHAVKMKALNAFF